MARPGETLDEYTAELEAPCGEEGSVTQSEVLRLLEELIAEGFIAKDGGRYLIA
jgi:hypothetical protein